LSKKIRTVTNKDVKKSLFKEAYTRRDDIKQVIRGEVWQAKDGHYYFKVKGIDETGEICTVILGAKRGIHESDY